MYLSVLRAIFLKSQGSTIELLGVSVKGRDGWGDEWIIFFPRAIILFHSKQKSDYYILDMIPTSSVKFSSHIQSVSHMTDNNL